MYFHHESDPEKKNTCRLAALQQKVKVLDSNNREIDGRITKKYMVELSPRPLKCRETNEYVDTPHTASSKNANEL